MLSNIVRLCKANGISVAELERRCGLKARTIYRWDSNKPSVDKVKKVANYFGVAMDALVAEYSDDFTEEEINGEH